MKIIKKHTPPKQVGKVYILLFGAFEPPNPLDDIETAVVMRDKKEALEEFENVKKDPDYKYRDFYLLEVEL